MMITMLYVSFPICEYYENHGIVNIAVRPLRSSGNNAVYFQPSQNSISHIFWTMRDAMRSVRYSLRRVNRK